MTLDGHRQDNAERMVHVHERSYWTTRVRRWNLARTYVATPEKYPSGVFYSNRRFPLNVRRKRFVDRRTTSAKTAEQAFRSNFGPYEYKIPHCARVCLRVPRSLRENGVQRQRPPSVVKRQLVVSVKYMKRKRSEKNYRSSIRKVTRECLVIQL